MVDITDREQILHISLNQDRNSFALGTTQAFWIYCLDPSIIRHVKRPFKGGVKLVQMVGISSFMLLVATGVNPEHPSD